MLMAKASTISDGPAVSRPYAERRVMKGTLRELTQDAMPEIIPNNHNFIGNL